MELFEAIKKRRSVRQFDPNRQVTEEQVNRILEAAIWAPSAGNLQSWHFTVVRDPKIKEELALRAGHQPFINDAPVVIVVSADTGRIGRSYGSRGRDLFSVQDTAAAVENILLAVTDMGLSSCWIGAFDESRAHSILKQEDHLRPVAILPIGYSDAVPNPPKRKPVNEVARFI